MKKWALAFCLLLLPSLNVFSKPTQVIIIRHAEKNLTGESLNPQGLSRAGALPYYFVYNPLYNKSPITYVFATRLKGPIELARTYQTCKPTADYLKLPIDTNYTHTEVQAIAHEILTNPKYDHSTILVCWTHGYIEDLVEALGGNNPGKWDKTVFDQVYVLTFDINGKLILRKELQKLMYGDRSSF
jgi:hypothetical protein